VSVLERDRSVLLSGRAGCSAGAGRPAFLGSKFQSHPAVPPARLIDVLDKIVCPFLVKYFDMPIWHLTDEKSLDLLMAAELDM
jgi:hypothetical protein